jgi:CRISPR-associated exonuclease Cas4
MTAELAEVRGAGPQVSVPLSALEHVAYCERQAALIRRRHEVPISEELLDRVRRAAGAMRALLAQERLPRAWNDARCRRCSLPDDCLPELTAHAGATVDPFVPRPLGTWRD